MKEMLKKDAPIIFILSAMSILAALFVSFIYKEEIIGILTKSFIFIIPIFTYLKNKDNIKQHGILNTIKKESVVLAVCVVLYLGVQMFTSYMLTKEIYKVKYLVDMFVLITEFLTLLIMLFIRKLYRRIDFVLLLALATGMFLIISRAKEYFFIIYLFYGLIDIGLIIELIILSRKYHNDSMLKENSGN